MANEQTATGAVGAQPQPAIPIGAPGASIPPPEGRTAEGLRAWHQQNLSTPESVVARGPSMEVEGPREGTVNMGQAPSNALWEQMGIIPQSSPELQPAISQAGGAQQIVGPPGTTIPPPRTQSPAHLAPMGTPPGMQQAQPQRVAGSQPVQMSKELDVGKPVTVVYHLSEGDLPVVCRGAIQNDLLLLLFTFRPAFMQPINLEVGGVMRRMINIGMPGSKPLQLDRFELLVMMEDTSNRDDEAGEQEGSA